MNWGFSPPTPEKQIYIRKYVDKFWDLLWPLSVKTPMYTLKIKRLVALHK